MQILVALVSIALFLGMVIHYIRKRQAEKPDCPEFDVLSVSEKFETAKVTNDNLLAMEQLATDLSICDTDTQKVIRLEWMGGDNRQHIYDLYCDGSNTATECMIEIADREIYDLKTRLSYQVEELSSATRRRLIGRPNNLEKAERGSINGFVRSVRERYFNR